MRPHRFSTSLLLLALSVAVPVQAENFPTISPFNRC
jgi:hypothetical protein